MPMLLWLLALSSILARGAIIWDYAHPKRYLIASSPSIGGIFYASLPRGKTLRTGAEVKILIANKSMGLVEPMGLAVDQKRMRLFVADPGASQIVMFPLIFSGDPAYLSVGNPTVWASGTSARWVAVDDFGSLFFSDEAQNQLLTVSAPNVLVNGSKQESQVQTPQVLYDGTNVVALNSPGAVQVDTFWIYYVNKQLGTQYGSVVRAPKGGVSPSWAADNPTLLQTVLEPITTNTDKSYGLCLVMQNLFYTQPEQYIYGALADNEGGGTYAVINDRLTNPRGCVFDGDGTVYVADRGAGAIYSFAGNQQKLQPALVTKTADLEDAFDVAFFSSAKRLALFVPRYIFIVLLGLAAIAASARPTSSQ